jgi:hypothetical protein
MEYLLGSLVTLLTMFVFSLIINKRLKSSSSIIKTPIYSQSFIHQTLRPFLPTNSELKYETKQKTQSSKLFAKNTVRVLFVENKAYWIKDHSVYSADVVDGLVDQESAFQLDMMAMDAVQLKEISFIIEKLTEGVDDENRYSGK